MLDSTAGPSGYLRSVTPSDSVSISTVTGPGGTLMHPSALYVSVAGDVVILAVGDTSAVTVPDVPAGSLLPIRALRVNATGTTAGPGEIIALY